MIQKEKIDGYSVIGYDKDNDIFVCYEKFEVLANAVDKANEVLANAVNKAKELTKQIENGELKRKCSDGTEESIDWIEVYWNWNKDDEQIIWGSYND